MPAHLVTVIIPAYNRADFLKNITLPSLMNQTYPSLECIVVDDGSTDNTKAIVGEFMSNSKIPIEYVFQENKGQGAARNTAINRARGKWILPLDSDDAILPGGIALLVEAAERECADIVWAQTWRVASKNKAVWGIGGSTPSSVLLSKKIFDDYGLYDEDRKILEDVDHLYRLLPLLAKGSIKLVKVDIPSSIYFIHKGQSTNLENPTHLLIKADAMIEKWGAHQVHDRQWNSIMAHWWRNKGSYEILAGKKKDGIGSLRYSLSFGFSASTVMLFVVAYFGRRAFRFLIVLRHFFERIAFRISEGAFILKYGKQARENIHDLNDLLQASEI
jgi:glycosyltransferase involved in cell wall biosynthesis